MKIVFMGTPAAAVPALERLISDGHEVVAVYTQPDRRAGRGQRVSFSPVKEFALQNGLTIIQPTTLRSDEALEVFRGFEADVAVVVAYGRILPESFLASFDFGAINIHFSLLPKFRGAAPVNWAIVNGESTTGVTIMQMDQGLDTGAILKRASIDISTKENAVELTVRLSQIGADLLSETLRDLRSIVPEPQDDEHASYAPMLKKSDGLVDWDLDARTIASRVRGFQPFPTSFSYLKGTKITFWRTNVSDSILAEPGKIITAEGDQLIVACGNGTTLAVQEIQAEGKRRTQVRDFLNGMRISVGEKFGDSNE